MKRAANPGGNAAQQSQTVGPSDSATRSPSFQHVDDPWPRVHELHGQLRSLGRQALGVAIDLGQALTAAKAQCKHGEWMPHLQKAGIAVRTAQAYMRLYAEREALADAQRVSHLDLSVREALKLLAKPRTNEPERGEPIDGKVVERTAGESDDPELPELATSAQPRLDAAMRAARRRLEREFQQRLAAAVEAELAELLPMYNRKHEQHIAVVRAYKGVFTRSEYRSLLGALHADKYGNASADERERLNRAFDLVRSKELELCGPPEPASTNTLPKTVAELVARRRSKKKRADS